MLLSNRKATLAYIVSSQCFRNFFVEFFEACFTCRYETCLQVTKALFNCLQKKSYKNEAKEKFITIPVFGWLLFLNARREKFTTNKR